MQKRGRQTGSAAKPQQNVDRMRAFTCLCVAAAAVWAALKASADEYSLGVR